MVLAIGLLYEWIYKIEVATLFLILASETTIDENGSKEASITVSSRFLI